MNIKNISVLFLLLLPCSSMAATISQFYLLTDNSHYSYSEADWANGNGDLVTTKSMLTGFLLVNIEDNHIVTIDYNNVLLNGNSFRPNETMTADAAAINSGTLVSGFTGEDDYLSYGNAALSPFPQLCVECGYEMTLNLGANPVAGNPLALSYHESNSYDTGEVHFEIFVSQVPVPASAWLFGSAVLGLLGIRRKNT